MAPDPDRRRRMPRGAHHALGLPQPSHGAAVRAEVRAHDRLAGGCVRRARAGTNVTNGARKRCTVAYATRERQYLWSVELAGTASIADALAAARASAAAELQAGIPW